MGNSLPEVGVCPKCGGSFRVKVRNVFGAMSSNPSDELEWSCSNCKHKESEHREKGAGVDGEWPASKFQR